MTGRAQRALDYLRWRAAGRPVDGPDAGYGSWRAAAELLIPPPARDVPISVVTPVLDPPLDVLDRCLASVAAQTHPDVEHVIVDAGCEVPAVRQRLAGLASSTRVRLVHAPGGIGATTNAGIAASTGAYVAFLDHDDELAPDALAWVASCAPAADLIYTDQDELDVSGRRCRPFFKPPWSPRLLWSLNYVNHLTCVRRSLLIELGGLREDIDGVQDHELLLRVAGTDPVVAHVPLVLYHWRRWAGSTSADPRRRSDLEAAALESVRASLARAGSHADAAGWGDEPFRYRLVGGDPGPVRVIGSPPPAVARWAAFLTDPRVRAVGGGSGPADGVSADALTRFPRERASLVGWAMLRADDPFDGAPDQLDGATGAVVGVPDPALPGRPGGWIDGSPHVVLGDDQRLRIDPRGPERLPSAPVRWAPPRT